MDFVESVIPNKEEVIGADNISLARRRGNSVASAARIGMEFETSDMFGSPNSRTQRVHRDAMLLSQQDGATPLEDSVLSLLRQWNGTHCRASVGSRGKFCIAVHCGVVSHKKAVKIPLEGFWYVLFTVNKHTAQF